MDYVTAERKGKRRKVSAEPTVLASAVGSPPPGQRRVTGTECSTLIVEEDTKWLTLARVDIHLVGALTIRVGSEH